jgi:hypothetical protein
VIIADRWAKIWIDCINNRDFDKILQSYSTDIEIRSPFAKLFARNGIVFGHDNLRLYWEEAARRLPNLTLSLIEVYSGHMSIALHHRDNSGRNTIETMFFDEADKVCLQSACLDRVR